MTRIIRVKLWVLILSFVLVIILLSFLFIKISEATDKVIFTWKQPEEVHCVKKGPFYLSVVEEGLNLSRFPFTIDYNYYIYVGGDSGKPIYGHTISYSFHNETSDLYEYIKKSDVKWTEKGVYFIEASGHELFIPSEMLSKR